jgi:hypothetical protein
MLIFSMLGGMTMLVTNQADTAFAIWLFGGVPALVFIAVGTIRLHSQHREGNQQEQ